MIIRSRISTASTLAVVVLLCATMGVKSNDDAAAKSGKSGGYKLFHDDCDGYDPRRDGYTDYGYNEDEYPGGRHRRSRRVAARGRRDPDSTEVRRLDTEATKAGKSTTTTTTTSSAKCSKVRCYPALEGYCPLTVTF